MFARARCTCRKEVNDELDEGKDDVLKDEDGGPEHRAVQEHTLDSSLKDIRLFLPERT